MPLRLAALFGITVTGIVYSTVLAQHPRAERRRAETFVNDIVHYVVPVMVVLGWLLFGPRPRVDARTVLAWSLLFPAGCGWPTRWCAARSWHWYPYPFLDVTHARLRAGGGQLRWLVLVVLRRASRGVFALGDRVPASAGVVAQCRADVAQQREHLRT